MKWPICTPRIYPDWPILRQAGQEDWLKCPVCKTLFYCDGRPIKQEDKNGKTRKGFDEQEKLIREFIREVSRRKSLSRK